MSDSNHQSPAAAGTAEERWCVVTGGRGFAARHLVEMLIRSPDQWRVRIADLGPAIKLDGGEENGVVGEALRSGRAAYVSADLRNRSQVVKAFEGAEVVFHMAAPDSSINNYKLHYSVNVEGTQNVIDACVECKVKRLIYTSSPSVVFDGIHGISNGTESMPYPEKFNDSYSETKAEGEKLVLKANGRGGLLTCCIRPSSIFGPGDKLLVPSLASAARAGKLKFMIGDGNNVYDFTYVENVAHGHICAERTLASTGARAEKAAGQAFIITNDDPIKFWEFVSLIVEGLGYERPSIKIPVAVVMPIGHLVELTYKLFSRYGMPVPQLTPSRIRLLSCNRTFSCNKAKVHLGYEPIVSLKDSLKRTIDSYSHLRAVHRSTTTSKASTILGSGYVGNVLLWRDKKQTLATFLLLVACYYYFRTSGYTFITAVAKLFSLAALFLFVHSLLPSEIFGIKIQKLLPSHFHLSEGMTQQVACSVTSSWNSTVGILKSLCKGKDWSQFFKVAIILLFINFLGAMSLQSMFIGVFVSFFGFVAYEKWEEEIDRLSIKASTYVLKVKSEATRRFSKH